MIARQSAKSALSGAVRTRFFVDVNSVAMLCDPIPVFFLHASMCPFMLLVPSLDEYFSTALQSMHWTKLQNVSSMNIIKKYGQASLLPLCLSYLTRSDFPVINFSTSHLFI